MVENKTVNIFENATMEDIIRDPHKYGAPTMEEYWEDPEKFKRYFTEDGKMGLYDKGPDILKNVVIKQICFVNGYKCETLEKAQQVANSENIDLRFITGVELIPIDNGKAEQHLFFNKKKENRGRLILPPGGSDIS